MKKKLMIMSVSAILIILGALIPQKDANASIIGDAKGVIVGGCAEIENGCLYRCEGCGRLWEATGNHTGPTTKVSGTCICGLSAAIATIDPNPAP